MTKRVRSSVGSLVVFSFLLLCAFVIQAAASGNIHKNDRFGFSLALPGEHKSLKSSPNGDGITVNYKDGMTLLAYGGYGPSVMGYDCKATFESALEFLELDTVTYRRLNEQRRWFVISGYKGDSIVYVKRFVGKTAEYAVEMRYPRANASLYDSFVRTVVESFTPGDME